MRKLKADNLQLPLVSETIFVLLFSRMYQPRQPSTFQAPTSTLHAPPRQMARSFSQEFISSQRDNKSSQYLPQTNVGSNFSNRAPISNNQSQRLQLTYSQNPEKRSHSTSSQEVPRRQTKLQFHSAFEQHIQSIKPLIGEQILESLQKLGSNLVSDTTKVEAQELALDPEYLQEMETSRLMSLTFENTLITTLYQCLNSGYSHRERIIEQVRAQQSEICQEMERIKRENDKIRESILSLLQKSLKDLQTPLTPTTIDLDKQEFFESNRYNSFSFNDLIAFCEMHDLHSLQQEALLLKKSLTLPNQSSRNLGSSLNQFFCLLDKKGAPRNFIKKASDQPDLHPLYTFLESKDEEEDLSKCLDQVIPSMKLLDFQKAQEIQYVIKGMKKGDINLKQKIKLLQLMGCSKVDLNGLPDFPKLDEKQAKQRLEPTKEIKIPKRFENLKSAKSLWTAEEVEKLNEGLKIYGRIPQRLSEYIQTKTKKQVQRKILLLKKRELNKQSITEYLSDQGEEQKPSAKSTKRKSQRASKSHDIRSQTLIPELIRQQSFEDMASWDEGIRMCASNSRAKFNTGRCLWFYKNQGSISSFTRLLGSQIQRGGRGLQVPLDSMPFEGTRMWRVIEGRNSSMLVVDDIINGGASAVLFHLCHVYLVLRNKLYYKC